MIKDVRVPWRLAKFGIGENHRGYPTKKHLRVFGADTETYFGEPYTFQVSTDAGRDFCLEYVNAENAFRRLMGWILPRCDDKGVNLVFFHNLRFDITSLLWHDQAQIYEQYNDIKIERDGYVLEMLYGRVNHVQIWQDLGGYKCKRCGNVPSFRVKRIEEWNRVFFVCLSCNKQGARRNLGTRLEFIDSAAFCPPGSKSLAAALKIYGVEGRKMDMLPGLGEKKLRGADFEKYAMNDAFAEEKLGSAILALHKEHDISPCVSLPMLSARILRHHFMRPGERFIFPPKKCLEAAEFSYHAGKNGFYVGRGVYEDVYEYDINSAFPKAMFEMPQMVRGRFKKVKRFNPAFMGIYEISGEFSAPFPKYPLVYDAAFIPCWPTFKREWITGYELERLRKDVRYKFKIHRGWVWKHDKKYSHSPLAEFVSKFYKLKVEAPKGPKRDTYKNILNSLYGKFAACVEKREKLETAHGDVVLGLNTSEKYFTAGSLYHPFIATQITGYVRGLLWELETRGQALHAATDSVKTFKKLSTSGELGGLKEEVFGRVYLFRNKLYLHFSKDTSRCGHDLKKGWLYVPRSEPDLQDVGERLETGKAWDAEDKFWRGKLFDADGQHLCKYALHGFKGSALELYKNRKNILRDGFLDYEYDHMVSLREGVKRQETVGTMKRRKERMTLAKKG